MEKYKTTHTHTYIYLYIQTCKYFESLERLTRGSGRSKRAILVRVTFFDSLIGVIFCTALWVT